MCPQFSACSNLVDKLDVLEFFACRKLLEIFQEENAGSNLYLIYIKQYDQMQPITCLTNIRNIVLGENIEK